MCKPRRIPAQEIIVSPPARMVTFSLETWTSPSYVSTALLILANQKHQ